jgi:hypothetical protein
VALPRHQALSNSRHPGDLPIGTLKKIIKQAGVEVSIEHVANG